MISELEYSYTVLLLYLPLYALFWLCEYDVAEYTKQVRSGPGSYVTKSVGKGVGARTQVSRRLAAHAPLRRCAFTTAFIVCRLTHPRR